MHRDYSALELSAIQEIVNIGTGNAATALSQLVAREVELGVPEIQIVPIWEAAALIGPAELPVTAILTPVGEDASVSIALIFPEAAASSLCRLLGTEHGTELGTSALQEIGNILTGSYVTALSGLTGELLEPLPPAFAMDMLGSVVDAIIAMAAGASDTVVLLRAAISITGEACDFSLLFLPAAGALDDMLTALGLAA
jgi:chemotaxis protein CheC